MDLVDKYKLLILSNIINGNDFVPTINKIKIVNPNIKIIILADSYNDTHKARAAVYGVNEYIAKSSSRKEILAAINRADKNQTQDSSLQDVIDVMAKKRTEGDECIPLTPRELQVIRHVAFGMSNKDIAKALTVSVETVKEHVQNILAKIRCDNRTKAAIYAINHQLVN